MFGYVMANPQELRPEQRERYLGCYCGICRAIGEQNSLASRLALNYDMVFLALLLSSLYEPAEEQSSGRCLIHPLSPRPWRRSEAIRYAADMNVALAYFSADDHWQDDRRPDALALRRLLRPHYEAIQSRFPRQCRAHGDLHPGPAPHGGGALSQPGPTCQLLRPADGGAVLLAGRPVVRLPPADGHGPGTVHLFRGCSRGLPAGSAPGQL